MGEHEAMERIASMIGSWAVRKHDHGTCTPGAGPVCEVGGMSESDGSKDAIFRLLAEIAAIVEPMAKGAREFQDRMVADVLKGDSK